MRIFPYASIIAESHIEHLFKQVEKYVRKLKLLMHIIVCWYSSDCLQDEECLQSLIRISHKFWPIGADADLQTVFMRMLFFISNNSLPGKIK